MSILTKEKLLASMSGFPPDDVPTKLLVSPDVFERLILEQYSFGVNRPYLGGPIYLGSVLIECSFGVATNEVIKVYEETKNVTA